MKHKVATREEWLAARGELLAREKELTRRGDQLAAERRELPWVPIEKEYSFGTDEGPKTLRELFDGRSQLITRNRSINYMIIGWVIIPSAGFPPARPQGNRAWSIPPGKGIPHLRPPRPASFARSHLSLAG